MARPDGRQRQFRPGGPPGFADPGRPLRHRAHPYPSLQCEILAPQLPSLTRLLHTFDYGQSCKSEATPTHPSQRETWRPDLKRLPWLVTCLSSTGQGELLATQNPDGSLVLSAVLKDEQGLLSFLLVPPSPKRIPTDTVTPARASQLWNPADWSVDVCILTPMETERCSPGLDCNSVAFVHILVIHSSVKLRSPPTRAKPG
jgi:hypothetical protein